MIMKILIINGPNLNLLGKREPAVYGSQSFEQALRDLRNEFGEKIDIEYYQSNHEGDIIDKLHNEGFSAGILGIILNAGAYTHTSLAIADAIAAIERPVVEVHISNISAREEIRHHSMITPVCKGIIAGFGMDGYRLAVEALLRR